MTRKEAEIRASELAKKEPKSTGLTFVAKLCVPMPTEWYVAGFYKGQEVNYSRDDD